MESSNSRFIYVIGFLLMLVVGYSAFSIFDFGIGQFLFAICSIILLSVWAMLSTSEYRWYVVALVVFFGLFYYTDATFVFSALRNGGMSILFSSSFQLVLIASLAAFAGYLVKKYVQKK